MIYKILLFFVLIKIILAKNKNGLVSHLIRYQNFTWLNEITKKYNDKFDLNKQSFIFRWKFFYVINYEIKQNQIKFEYKNGGKTRMKTIWGKN